jgi:hypothetical protein
MWRSLQTRHATTSRLNPPQEQGAKVQPWNFPAEFYERLDLLWARAD